LLVYNNSYYYCAMCTEIDMMQTGKKVDSIVIKKLVELLIKTRHNIDVPDTRMPARSRHSSAVFIEKNTSCFERPNIWDKLFYYSTTEWQHGLQECIPWQNSY
jgi:hypothetical protein